MVNFTAYMKRFISVMLVCALATPLYISGEIAQAAGEGNSPSNPILIRTPEQFENISLNSNKHYRLVNDLDFANYDYYAPIRNFSGTLDGGGFAVSNLSIQQSREAGLFSTSGGTIKNLHVVNIRVNGYNNIGGVVGQLLPSGIIENVHVSGQITASYSCGGVAGRNDGTIRFSSSSASTSGGGHCGSLVGNMQHETAKISNSYANGPVTLTANGSGDAGGLVGYLNGMIENSYATGRVSSVADSNRLGGLVGGTNTSATVNRSYWDHDTSQQQISPLGQGHSTTEMQDQTTFAGWDFATVWTMGQGGYPTLRPRVAPVPLIATSNLAQSILSHQAGFNQLEIAGELNNTSIIDHLTLNYTLVQEAGSAIPGYEDERTLLSLNPGATSFSGQADLDPELPEGQYAMRLTAHTSRGALSAPTLLPFTIDTTPPVIAFIPEGQEQWAPSAAVKVSASDTGSGMATEQQFVWTQQAVPPVDGWQAWDGHTELPLTNEGEWYLHVRMSDTVGNLSAASSQRYRLDHTAPTVAVNMQTATGEHYPDNTWTNRAVVVAAAASDNIQVVAFDYSLDEGVTWTPYTDTLTWSNDGKYEIWFRAADSAGNLTIEKRAIKINTSGLKLTSSLQTAKGEIYESGQWTKHAVHVELLAEAPSGVTEVTYAVNGGSALPYDSTLPLTFKDEGTHHITFRVIDQASNVLTEHVQLKIDLTPPSILVAPNGAENWQKDIEVQLKTEDVRSGIDATSLHYAWSLTQDPPDEADWVPLADTEDGRIKAAGRSGIYYLHARVQDLAGNLTQTVSERYLLNDSAARLTDLQMSPGPLEPIFSPDITAYTVRIPADTETVILAPVSEHADDSIELTVNAQPSVTLRSNEPSMPIAVSPGRNELTLTVTALHGEQKLYTITLYRETPTNPTKPTTPGPTVPAPTAPTPAYFDATEGPVYYVSPAGRTIMFSSGAFIVPEAAWPQGFYLTLETLNATAGMPLPASGKLIGSIIQWSKQPSGDLLKEAIWRLPMDESDAIALNTQSLHLYRLNDNEKEWSKQTHAHFQSDEGTIITSFDRPGIYAIMALPHSDDAISEEGATEPGTDQQSFRDLDGHWAQDAIRQGVLRNMVHGYPDGTFRPDHPVTRAEFIALLMRTNVITIPAIPNQTAALTFADEMHINDWARSAITQAVQAGIVYGFEDGTFRPQTPILRWEMSLIIARVLALTTFSDMDTSFADTADLPVEIREAISALHRLGLVQGRGADRFEPRGPLTRAEAVTVLLHMQMLLEETSTP